MKSQLFLIKTYLNETWLYFTRKNLVKNYFCFPIQPYKEEEDPLFSFLMWLILTTTTEQGSVLMEPFVHGIQFSHEF